MITRPRQISLRQMTLHFSCTATAPHTGQMIGSLPELELGSSRCDSEKLITRDFDGIFDPEVKTKYEIQRKNQTAGRGRLDLVMAHRNSRSDSTRSVPAARLHIGTDIAAATLEAANAGPGLVSLINMETV